MVGNYYYDDDETRRWPRYAMAGAVAVLIAGAGFWVVTSDDAGQPGSSALAQATSATAAVARGDDPVPAEPAPAAPTAASRAPAPTTTAPTTTPDAPTVAVAPPATPAPTETTETTASNAAPAVSASLAAAPADGAGYPTSADGAPLPVIVTYDTDVITITGFVPSAAAKDRLGALAVANSKTAARLENQLVVDPDVPIGVGVRVIELNSVRFPDGSAEIRPDHAAELQRVAAVMDALPNVTALVIGHADQRGDEATNVAVSAERAAAVVDFLIYLGVSPTRLAARAAGEADLLTLGDDATALALNRRTEFVLYGVLVE